MRKQFCSKSSTYIYGHTFCTVCMTIKSNPLFEPAGVAGNMTFEFRTWSPSGGVDRGTYKDLSSSGSNQAREGRLVNALAVRGDEGRDNLR